MRCSRFQLRLLNARESMSLIRTHQHTLTSHLTFHIFRGGCTTCFRYDAINACTIFGTLLFFFGIFPHQSARSLSCEHIIRVNVTTATTTTTTNNKQQTIPTTTNNSNCSGVADAEVVESFYESPKYQRGYPHWNPHITTKSNEQGPRGPLDYVASAPYKQHHAMACSAAPSGTASVIYCLSSPRCLLRPTL